MQIDYSVLGSVASLLSALAAFFAAFAAFMSWRVAQRAYADQRADDEIVLGPLQHPELLHPEHSWAVLATHVVNRSRRKAVIKDVRLTTMTGKPVSIRWSGAIDNLGNAVGVLGVLGVVDSATLYLRREDGKPICDGVLEIRHSFAPEPLRLVYEMTAGWEEWMMGGVGPKQAD
jgi:hypothetical protein